MEKLYKAGDKYFSKSVDALRYEFFELEGYEEFQRIIKEGMEKVSSTLSIEFLDISTNARIIDYTDEYNAPENCYVYKTVCGSIIKEDGTIFNFSLTNDENGFDSDQGNFDSVDKFMKSLLFKIGNIPTNETTNNGNIIKGEVRRASNGEIYVSDTDLKSILGLYDGENIEINIVKDYEEDDRNE